MQSKIRNGHKPRGLEIPFIWDKAQYFSSNGSQAISNLSYYITGTAGVHQMRLLHRHSLYHCLRCHLMTFYPEKRAYSSFENNAGQTDLRTYGPTDGPTDGYDLL